MKTKKTKKILSFCLSVIFIFCCANISFVLAKEPIFGTEISYPNGAKTPPPPGEIAPLGTPCVTSSINLNSRAANLILVGTMGCSKRNDNRFNVSIETKAKDVMGEIGVKSYKFQKWINGNWTDLCNFNIIIKNQNAHYYSYATTIEESGYYYRISGYHYAKENTWFFPQSQEEFNCTSSQLLEY